MQAYIGNNTGSERESHLALTVEAEELEFINKKIKTAINKITTWMEEHDLELAPTKTEAGVLKGPRKRDGIQIIVKDTRVELKKAVKYPGIMIDAQGTFGHHVNHVPEKADKSVAALTKIMPNIGGPGSQKRHVLLGVVHSTILYGAPVWHTATRVERHRKILEKTQRKMLLRVACAYRTTSTLALQVITGTLPICLLIQERKIIWETPPQANINEAKREARQQMMEYWQNEWDENTTKAQWTKRIIPDITTRVKCNHKRTNYYVTQALSGYGSFRTYTKKIGKDNIDTCRYCEERDDPEHTLFNCSR